MDKTITNTDFIDTLYRFEMSRGTDQTAQALIRKARKVFEMAEAERKFGEKISRAILGSETAPDKDLASISIWHCEQGLWRYREAIIKFEQAKKISRSPVFKKFIDLRIKECIRYAMICRSLLQKLQLQEKSLIENKKLGEQS